jgi:hypothetical protein
MKIVSVSPSKAIPFKGFLLSFLLSSSFMQLTTKQGGLLIKRIDLIKYLNPIVCSKIPI